jgi:hypothetical protein
MSIGRRHIFARLVVGRMFKRSSPKMDMRKMAQ